MQWWIATVQVTTMKPMGQISKLFRDFSDGMEFLVFLLTLMTDLFESTMQTNNTFIIL